MSSTPAFNQQLVYAALFGDPLLINDGYVLFNKAVRQAVLKPKSSPLTKLVECGYARFLTRNGGSLGGLAASMAANGITSAVKLVSTKSYKQEYQPRLSDWASKLQSTAFDAFVGWPNLQVDRVFRNVAEAAFASLRASETAQARKQLDNFKSHLDQTASRRTEWEDTADGLRDKNKLDPAAYKKLMHTANEAYQYAWGCALLKSQKSVRVQTRLPLHMAGFDLPVGEAVSKRRPSTVVLVPNILFATEAVGDRWNLLSDMLTTGSEPLQAKSAFQKALVQYYTSDEMSDDEMKDAADKYSRALSHHFARPKLASFGVSVTFLVMSTSVGAATAGPLGAAIGFGIGAAELVAGQLGADQLLLPLTAPKKKGWIARHTQPNLGPRTSSFELNPSHAAQFLKGVPAFSP